jgi:hypothetical protein
MRILLLLLAIAATLSAQSPASKGSIPGWQSIVNSMLSQNTGASPSGVAPATGNLAVIKPSPDLVAALRARASAQTTEINLGAQPGARPASPCSVPLLRAQIPTDVNFTMQTIEPPTNKVDHMQVAVPAPACLDAPR